MNLLEVIACIFLWVLLFLVILFVGSFLLVFGYMYFFGLL